MARDAQFYADLHHRCEIRRETLDSPAVRTNYGQKERSWTQVADDVHCRLMPARAALADELTWEAIATKSSHVLLIEFDVDIQAKDNVIVVDRGRFNVQRVTDPGGAGHHWECFLEKVA